MNSAQVIAFPIERRVQPPPRRLVPLSELQAMYGFSERWWRYRIRDGMPSHRWAGGLRFDTEEVETWMREHAHGA